MHTMWVLVLSETVKCRGKLTDVCRMQTPKQVKCKCTSCEKKTDDELIPMGNPRIKSIFQHTYLRRWYYELVIGDPSRNIIEKIFRAASTNPSNQIKKVLRVNNTRDTLEKFEKYRESVKAKSSEHPRSVVDGNELLQFYVTTMNCCTGKKEDTLERCKDPTCCVCSLIQSGFHTINGIRLSATSDAPSQHTSCIKMNAKRAVIICRTIAGRVLKNGDIKVDEDYDSVVITGIHPKSHYLIVKDPSALLPCFVIVFN